MKNERRREKKLRERDKGAMDEFTMKVGIREDNSTAEELGEIEGKNTGVEDSSKAYEDFDMSIAAREGMMRTLGEQ